MSRCFPYPPPGYVRNGMRDEALIESIKLQREGEKAKKERKKEKKRGKKREKRENEKAWGSGDTESDEHDHKKRHKNERSTDDQKGGNLQNRKEKETEQLEKSCLTEERGLPMESQTSSDSTLTSNNRQKLSSPPTDGRHNSGSIIRIRLPSQRHKYPEVLPIKEQPCIALGRTDDVSIKVMHQPALRLGKERAEFSCSPCRKVCPELATQPSEEKPCCPIGVTEGSAQKHQKPYLSTGVTESSVKIPCLSPWAFESSAELAETSMPSNLCGRCSPQSTSKFRDVIDNWVPLPVQSDCTDFDDLDWLFETKQNQRSGARKCELDGVGLSHANLTSWPRVCYLPEADIYVLPFTVPF